MTIKQLIEELAAYEPDRLVVLSRDEEGNGYLPLAQIDSAKFHDGEIGLEELTPELEKQGYSDEDVMKRGKRAVVLYP
jgi:hypothetical protein